MRHIIHTGGRMTRSAIFVAAITIATGAMAVAYFEFVRGESEAASIVPSVREYYESLPPENLPDAQRAALSDGQVDDAEYQAALEATAACMEAEGLNVTIVPGEGAAPDTLEVEMPAEDGSPASGPSRFAAAAASECEQRHLTPIVRARHLQQQNDRAGTDAALALLSTCMRERGVGLESDYTLSSLDARLYDATMAATAAHGDGPEAPEAEQWLRAHRECRRFVESELGYRVP